MYGLPAKALCFGAVRPSVRLSGQIYCRHNISWTDRAILMKLTGNIHWPLLMTRLDSGCQRSKVKVIAGRWDGEGIHIEVLVLKLCWYTKFHTRPVLLFYVCTSTRTQPGRYGYGYEAFAHTRTRLPIPVPFMNGINDQLMRRYTCTWHHMEWVSTTWNRLVISSPVYIQV